MARRRGGIGLGGLLVIIGLLYFTGAGKWLWERVKTFDQSCYAILVDIGTDMGTSVCSGFGSAVRAIDDAASNFGDTAHNYMFALKERIHSWLGGADFSGLTGQLRSSLMAGTSPLNGWVSPSDKLAQMMNGSPIGIGSGASPAERIRSALDNFVIGQHFLNSGGSAAGALPWLQQGATQPGYGIMSQLALGDLYRNGASDLPVDPMQARYYYQEAQQSLGMLMQSNAPESAQLLQSLPASPTQIQQQLTSSIAQLNKQITHH